MISHVPTHAMILAAGRGKRMRPLTDHQPKPLLPVAGVPLIFYHLRKLADAGVQHVVINHAWCGDKLQAAIGDGEAFGVHVHWSAEPAGGLETAGGIIRALPLLGGADFIVVNGDVWSDYDYAALPRLSNQQLGHLVLVDNPSHHPTGDFSLAGTAVELAAEGRECLTFAGISVLSSALFDGYPDEVLKLRPFFERAIQQQRLHGEYFAGAWCDVGTPARLAQLDQQLRASQQAGG